MKLKDVGAVDALFAELGEYEIAVASKYNAAFLIYTSVDGELCYQGVPILEDPDGDHGKVDQNRGMLADLAPLWWPLRYLGPHRVPVKRRSAAA